jgi:hypothetical protein
MTERPTERLETALRDLGAHLDVPEPPELTGPVLTRLARLPAEPEAARSVILTRVLPRLVAAVVVALLALGVAMAVSPTVRAAVFDLLRIGGVEIHHEPAPIPPPFTGRVELPGERVVSLAEARRAAPFEVAVPASLGDPDEVRIADGDPPRVVSLLYDSGIRIDQFDGRISPVFFKKTDAADMEMVRVGSVDGVWVPSPHPLLYVDREGKDRVESARLAAKTLIWEADGVTYRLEGELSREEAIRIAESL